MKALDGIFSPYKPVFIYTENLSFDVATFISYLCWIFLITYCSFYNSTYCFTVYIYVTKMASQSSSTNFCYNSFKLSAASSPLSAFIKVKKVRALLWIRLFDLRKCDWLVFQELFAGNHIWLTGTRQPAFSPSLLLTCLPHYIISSFLCKVQVTSFHFNS